MLYKKITAGSVIQTFNDQGECLDQQFVADDLIMFETEDGYEINEIDMPFGGKEYFPFDMIQPTQFCFDVESLIEYSEDPF